MAKCKVALLLSKGFEEIETITVWDILRRADIVVVGISTDNTPHVRGGQRIFVEPDLFLKELVVDDFEALIVPGGSLGAKLLGENEEVLDVIRTFRKNRKLVAAICAGPIVLEKAGLLKEKKVTSYPGMEESFKDSLYLKENIVEDDDIITSRGIGTAIEFSLYIVEKLKGKNVADKIAKDILVKR